MSTIIAMAQVVLAVVWLFVPFILIRMAKRIDDAAKSLESLVQIEHAARQEAKRSTSRASVSSRG